MPCPHLGGKCGRTPSLANKTGEDFGDVRLLIRKGAHFLLATLLEMPTLGNRLEARHANNLDFLRFLAAGLVIIGHCFAFLGIRRDPLVELTGYQGFSSLGVNFFFFISGMLITRSWLITPSPPAFWVKRCLRIFPGLVVAVLFCVLIVGPMATDLPMASYFSHRDTYRFLWNCLWPDRFFFLPGVFEHHPNAAVNGSLWTLPYELCCYLIVFCAAH